MDIEIKEDERIDDLEYKGLKIIQNKKGFCFGIDSILLSDFAKDIKTNAGVIDLGTGTGIIATLLCKKTKLKNIIGVEIQEEVYDMAKRSIKLNELEEKFSVINTNIKNLKQIYSQKSFDAVVTNPPYKKINTGIMSKEEKNLISRHEVQATLEDFIDISEYLLKDKGEFYIVHRPDRLVDILCSMRQHKIEPKNIKFICPKKEKRPNLVLIKGIKNGKPFLKFEPNLYVYDEDGKYTRRNFRNI